MPKDLSAKFYQETKEDHKKEPVTDIKVFPKKKKEEVTVWL